VGHQRFGSKYEPDVGRNDIPLVRAKCGLDFIRTESPRESQEKSVAASAACLIAVISPALFALRLAAAMLTLASRPDTKVFSAAPTKPEGIAAAAERATISFINSRRSMPGQDRIDSCLLVKIALLYLSLFANLVARPI
jgi:hypothetical protein